MCNTGVCWPCIYCTCMYTRDVWPLGVELYTVSTGPVELVLCVPPPVIWRQPYTWDLHRPSLSLFLCLWQYCKVHTLIVKYPKCPYRAFKMAAVSVALASVTSPDPASHCPGSVPDRLITLTSGKWGEVKPVQGCRTLYTCPATHV